MVEDKGDFMSGIFKSRKFWTALIAVVASGAALALGEIDAWQFIQALIAVAAAYSTGIALEDAGEKIGNGK